MANPSGRVSLHDGLLHLFGHRAKQHKSSRSNIDQAIYNLLSQEDEHGGKNSNKEPAKESDPHLR